MKKFYKLFILSILVLLPTYVSATSDSTIKDEYFSNVTTTKKVYDYASILSDKTEANLQNDAEDIYEKYKVDFVVMTTNLETKETTYSLAQTFYHKNGFGYGTTSDGIILVIDEYHHEYYVLTVGKALDVITKNKIEKIQNEMDRDMKLGNYDDAVSIFVKQTKRYYFYHNYGPPLLWVSVVVIGIVVAYFEVKREKKKLKLITDSLDASYYYDDEHIDFKNETLINQRERIITNSGSTTKTSNKTGNSIGKGRNF